MLKEQFLAILLAAGLLPMTAMAQAADNTSNVYLGIGWNSYQEDADGLTASDVDVEGVELTLGYRFSEIVSGELQLAFLEWDDADIAVGDSIIHVTGPDVESQSLSVLFHRRNPTVSPFIRLGWGRSETDNVNATFQGRTLSVDVDSDDGYLFGAGIDIDLQNNFVLRGAFRRFEGGVEGFALTAIYKL